MRNLFLVPFALALFMIGAVGLGAPRSKISQVSDGTLTGGIYTNDAVGLSYEVPGAWAAVADPKGPVDLDRKPDGKANQCTKVLLKLDALPQVEAKFHSMATLLAIDPGCFSGTEFPQSWMEKDKINKVTDKIIKAFSNSPYFSPYGVTIIADRSRKDHLIIQLTGRAIINAVEGNHPKTKEPLEVNTMFSFTESNGYWVALAYLADNHSTEELKSTKIVFKDDPSR
jgi:hypothetical protein